MAITSAALADADKEAKPNETHVEAKRPAQSRSQQAAILSLEAARAQLDRAMSQLGGATGQSAPQMARELDAFASQAAQLAKRLEKPALKLMAHEHEAQARYLQAEVARRQLDAREASHRVHQLRGCAWQIKERASPSAPLIGDFWLMQADLFDLNRTQLNPSQHQYRAMQRIERFLRLNESIAPSDSAQNLITDTHLVLLGLYDQMGLSVKAKDLLQNINAVAKLDPPARAHLKRQYEYIELIGQRIELQVETTAGNSWSIEEHHGKIVVLQFFRDAESYQQLRAMLQLDRTDVSYLKVILPRTPGDEVHEIAGPSTIEGASARLSDQFFVRSLPRVVLIGPDGHIEAMGGLAIRSVLDRMLSDLPVGEDGASGAVASGPSEPDAVEIAK